MSPPRGTARRGTSRLATPRRRTAGQERRLGIALDEALVGLDAHVERDPLRFPQRYLAAGSPGDAEIAAVFAAQLAFGRVDLFGPVLERLFAEMDAVGGPLAWCRGGARGEVQGADPLVYRWFTRRDFVALGVALARLASAEGLAAAFTPDPRPPPPGLPKNTLSVLEPCASETALEAGVRRLRALAAPGPAHGPFFDTWFALPSSGSACKRWCMFLRWMVRTGTPDLGLWTHLSPATLVMPVDTHVLKIARLTGLTQRRAANWRTALEITARLRAFCPSDPVRYDFALAHLGISAGCTGAPAPACDTCAMRPVCSASAGTTLPSPPSAAGRFTDFN